MRSKTDHAKTQVRARVKKVQREKTYKLDKKKVKMECENLLHENISLEQAFMEFYAKTYGKPNDGLMVR